MIYGYLRVSSDEQDVNSQKQGVEQFAKDKGWTIDKYITDEGVSGGKDPNKKTYISMTRPNDPNKCTLFWREEGDNDGN
ncbi:MAG: recombinase family protein [Muribaculaceae bacterium]